MSEQQPPWDPYGQQEQRRREGQPSFTPNSQYEPPYGQPPYQGRWPTGPPGGQQAYRGPGYDYGPQPPRKRPRKRTQWVRNVLAGIGAVVVASAVLSPISTGGSGGRSSAVTSSSPAARPAAARTGATFSGSGHENTPRFTVTAAWKLTAAAQGSGDYGAWALSQGDMPHSITSGLGDTLAQAEAAAVQACEAAGGGSGGSGGCYARSWFENAYSSFAYDASGGYWGVSDASTSADADSLALSYCEQSGAKDCGIVGRAQTASPSPTSPSGAVIQATPSYGVWAISPSAQIAGWGAGDTIQSAQQAAAVSCEQDGGVAAECSVYGGWVENGYSAIDMGANDTWSISVDGSPSQATDLAQHECQTVKAVGLACALKGSGSTEDPWVARNLGWIDQPTTLPTQSSPTFVCVTGPKANSSCLQPGAGVPQRQNLGFMPPDWLTSPVTGGCVLEFVPGIDALDLLENIGDAVRLDESSGNWFVLLTQAMADVAVDDCTTLAYYVLTGKPVPQNLDSSQGADLRPSRDTLDSANLPTRDAGIQSLFQPVPESQLKALEKLPFLHQRFGYAVAQVGSAAAVSRQYPAGWSAGTQKSVVCQSQGDGYRCNWRFQLKGTSHSGYVLIAVTGNSYRLAKVVQLAQAAARPVTTTGLNPLWYVLIAVAALAVVIAIVWLARRRRTRAMAR